jgi:type VI protein secretion system component VasF
VLATFGSTTKNLIMQKIKQIWKELNGQPTERTDKIITWWIIFCCVALMIAAYCG